MAIEVISKGTKTPPTYTRTCPECGCKFSYVYKDTIGCNWLGGYQAVICPQCDYPVAHLVAGGGSDINHPLSDD